MAEQPKVLPKGDLIRQLRADQGFKTLEKFAEQVGLDVRVVRAAEKGKPSTVNAVMAIYNLLVIKKPNLEYDDLITTGFDAGFRKEDDATPEDIQLLVKWILAQPDVEYAVFVRKRPLSSVLIEIELTADTIANVIIPAFVNQELDQFEVTALYLPFAFQQHIVPPFKYLYPALAVPVMFEHWLKRRGFDAVGTSLLNDGTLILTWRLPIEAEVLA